jgi:uncharacterized membrane protein
MIYFDYLYYLIYKFYSSKEKGAASSSAGILGGLQASNVLTFLMLFSGFMHTIAYLNKVFFIIVFIYFQIATYIRYILKEKNSISNIEERWLRLDESKRLKIKNFGILYVVLSVVVFFGLTIYLGSKRN